MNFATGLLLLLVADAAERRGYGHRLVVALIMAAAIEFVIDLVGVIKSSRRGGA